MYQNLTNANTKLMAYLTTGNDEDSDFSSSDEEEEGGLSNKPVTPEFLKKVGFNVSMEQFASMFNGVVPSEMDFLEFVKKQVS
jgi:hypothetical protein